MGPGEIRLLNEGLSLGFHLPFLHSCLSSFISGHCFSLSLGVHPPHTPGLSPNYSCYLEFCTVPFLFSSYTRSLGCQHSCTASVAMTHKCHTDGWPSSLGSSDPTCPEADRSQGSGRKLGTDLYSLQSVCSLVIIFESWCPHLSCELHEDDDFGFYFPDLPVTIRH